MRSCKFESCPGHLKALNISAFSFMYDEIPGIRSVVSPGRQSEAAAPGENRSAPHAHTQIAHRSRDLAMPQCLRDRCQRHIFRLEKIRGEGSTDRMRRDRFARRDARRIPGPCSVPATAPVSGRSQTADEAVLRLSGRPERRLWSQQANKASEQNGICRSVPHSPAFIRFRRN